MCRKLITFLTYKFKKDDVSQHQGSAEIGAGYAGIWRQNKSCLEGLNADQWGVTIQPVQADGQLNVGSSLTGYENKIVGEGACQSTCHPEVACDGNIANKTRPTGVSHMYRSSVS